MQQFPHSPQHRITFIMTIGVIIFFEIIDVQHQIGQIFFAGGGLLNFLHEYFIEISAVIKSCQFVGNGNLLD
ncbi:hypothetical protein D3C72_2449270 [compost metagenome]